jgi:hypothetical protein
MSFPLAFVLMLAGLIVSARVRLSAVLFGQPVSIPYLGIIFAVLMLALVVFALYLIRVLAQEFRKEPEPIIKTVRWERI